MATAATDPILASVLQRRVVAISQEMATVLMRSSRSPIFNEIGDLVTVIFDRSGRTLAQTEYASIIANAAQPPLAYIIEYFDGDLHDGDVILHNDVYTGGNQNADVGVFVPIFHDGELVAWTASKGHVADIGGMTAGGYNPLAREVWQEAFRIPPVKLHDRGQLRRDVWDLVRANIRLDIVAEDIQAMIGACTIGKRRLLELLGRYDVEVFERHMDYVIEASERQVRAEIERWPDGVYRGESWMVSDGLDPAKRYRIAVSITIDGSDITFDFSDTDDQAPGLHQHAARVGHRCHPDRVPYAGHTPAEWTSPLTAGCSRPSTLSSAKAHSYTRASRQPRSLATRCATRCSRPSCSRSPTRCPTA